MDTLLQPDIGLMVWTVVTFLVVVWILKKFVWTHILEGLETREGRLRQDLERAETSQKEAESLRLQYENQLSEAQKSIQGMITEARKEGDKARVLLLDQAKEESGRILEKGRRDLEAETDRLKRELQEDISGLSIMVAETVLRKSMTEKIQEEVVKESMDAIKGVRK